MHTHSLVQEDRVVRKPGLLGHSLLQVDINLNVACQQVAKIRRLEEPLKHDMQLTEYCGLAEAFWDGVRRPWAMAICQEDVDAMWCTWTWAAEDFLLLKLDEDCTAASVMQSQWPGPPVLKMTEPEMSERGRGTTRTTTVTKLSPNKKLPSRAPKTRVIKLMDAIRGSRKSVLRYVHRREASEEIRPGKWPIEVQRCWEAARNGMSQLQKEGPLPEGVAQLPADTLSTNKELTRVMEAPEASVRTRARAKEKARVQAWKQWIDNAWAETPRTVYRWIRGAGDAALQMVKKSDGTYTANIAEMDSVIRAAWQPINGRYAEKPEPSVEQFMKEYRRHIRHSAMTARVLTREVLQERARKMGMKTANGIDQWSIALLTRLPTPFWDTLAELLRMVERTGTWPQCVAEGFTSLVPKGEGEGDPMKL